jgi:hypothetical protein
METPFPFLGCLPQGRASKRNNPNGKGLCVVTRSSCCAWAWLILVSMIYIVLVWLLVRVATYLWWRAGVGALNGHEHELVGA